ncbi:MAG: ABC transporter permease [Candidatus Pelagadaptatus aseana]|uniref:ABC transporter permease n=1 Tax=Candidatus Pelagadaptatus aseana TaxID=3120508 RepID=UPI0039B32401
MLAWRQFWRSLRTGEVRILAASLILSVAVVSCIAVFTSRLENTLIQQSHSFLGGDRVIRSSQPIAQNWLDRAGESGLNTAQTVSFASMVFAGEEMHLSAVKAVSEGYPLAGELVLADQAFTTDKQLMQPAEGIPERGEAWVDSRLLPLLNIELGDTIQVGEQGFTISKIIVAEPDRGSNFSLIGARVMINQADLAATNVVQPGSRIRYRMLLSGADSDLQAYLADLEPELSVHQQIIDLESSQRGLAKTLSTARSFLLIAAVVGVLLSGVAIAIAARHFAALQVEQIALLKSLGSGVWKIRRLYMTQLLLLGLGSSLVGLALGELLQQWVASVIGSVFAAELLSAHWSAYGLGLLTGFICLFFFVVPPLWRLPLVPPIRILRRDMQISLAHQYLQFVFGLMAIALLVFLFSGHIALTGGVLLALLALVLVSVLLALVLLRGSRRLGSRAGSIWRLGISALERNRQFSVIQMLVFALAIMLLLSMTALRTNLIGDWQTQLPEGTPNHFLLNIEQGEITPIAELFEQQGIEAQPFYPMLRARVTHINGVEPDAGIRERAEALRREVNLSWSESMGADNRMVAGQWWDQWQSMGENGVSVEAETAEQMGLKLDDELTFSVGGIELVARVASIRTVQWDSMNPNFYFLFSPSALEDYFPAYLTSVYLTGEQKLVLNDLLRAFPTVVVIEMDRVIEQIQTIVEQVSGGVELVLVLILLGGVLVMWAAVVASMDERRQETVLLRALGCSRNRLLGSLWVEFCVLGVCAGLMAVLGSEVLLLSLQSGVLDMELSAHWYLWPIGILGGGLAIALMGIFACRQVVTVPPGQVLRELG